MPLFVPFDAPSYWLTFVVGGYIVLLCAFRLRWSSSFGSNLESAVNMVALSLWAVVTTLSYIRLFQQY